MTINLKHKLAKTFIYLFILTVNMSLLVADSYSEVQPSSGFSDIDKKSDMLDIYSNKGKKADSELLKKKMIEMVNGDDFGPEGANSKWDSVFLSFGQLYPENIESFNAARRLYAERISIIYVNDKKRVQLNLKFPSALV